MKYRSLLIIGTIVLGACSPTSPNQMGNGGMMQGGSMMGNNQAQTTDLLPGQNQDPSSLSEAVTSSVIEVQDGQTISLNPTMVRKAINGSTGLTTGGKKIAMYGYNGEIPGPLLKVKQGSTFTVNVTNNIDLPTSIHWHGLRLDNGSDGAVGVTQQEIKPGDSFSYTIKVPDEGIYWYHTHVREDLQQAMGLYGNILVTPADAKAYSLVNHDEVLAVTDLLLDRNGDAVPYGTSQADHTLMGRFGNTMLVNGQTDYKLDVSKGDVVRFYLTNTANTRTFRFNFGPSVGSPLRPRATEGQAGQAPQMKLVGGDNGRYEQEQFVDSVTLSPSERAIVDVLFDKSGTYTFSHQTPDRTYTLGTVTVGNNATTTSYAAQFAQRASHADVSTDIDIFRSSFDKEPDHTLVLDMNMMGGGMMGGHGGMMGEIPKDGIEWEDAMGMMNATAMGNMMQWKMIDQATGAANKDLLYTAKVGDKVKIRIINKKDSAHPMQHPIHFHGQRFLVLSDNGVATTDFVWKDTALIPAGHTVDILLDASNPGDWMFHCHIAEHLSTGMAGMLKVE